ICPDPLFAVLKASTLTQRVRLGTAVRVLPLDNPLRVAENAALVDQLAGGRLDLAVGRGYQKHEYEGFGVSMEESRERFAEAVDVMKGAWTKQPFDFQGKYYKANKVTVYPSPA